MKNCIVRSGAGYFVKFAAGGTPEMTSDPVAAERMEWSEADLVVSTLKQLGYGAELVKVIKGEYHVR